MEAAGHLLGLLEAAVGQGQASGQGGQDEQGPDLDNSGAPSAGALATALRRAVGIYKLSMAGPAPHLEYSSAALHPACEHVRQAFQQSRLADFELAGPSPPAAAAPKQAAHLLQTPPRRHSAGEGELHPSQADATAIAHPGDDDDIEKVSMLMLSCLRGSPACQAGVPTGCLLAHQADAQMAPSDSCILP